MSSIAEIVDKLATINNKLFLAQEIVYIIRHMQFEEYKKEFFETEDGARRLWEGLKKCTDLNVSRANLMEELDLKIVDVIQSVIDGKNKDALIQRANKTY